MLLELHAYYGFEHCSKIKSICLATEIMLNGNVKFKRFMVGLLFIFTHYHLATFLLISSLLLFT